MYDLNDLYTLRGMISVINYTGRFLFTALFVIINNILKRCHHLIYIMFFFKKELLTKETKLVLYS